MNRHLRRIEWLKSNLTAVAKYTGLPVLGLKLVPLLVTNETVPMQFFKDMNFPVSQVVPYENLTKQFRPTRSR